MTGPRYTAIVAGTDGSARSRRAVRHAADLAQASGAVLHLVSAYPPGDHAEVADRLERVAAETCADGEGVAVRLHPRNGDPAQVLCAIAEAEAAEVIVVGNRGMQGVDRFMRGSVPNRVSHSAGCSVLIVDTAGEG